MLFGRKNPPVGAPKTQSADPAIPAAPQAGAAEPATAVSPLASLSNPSATNPPGGSAAGPAAPPAQRTPNPEPISSKGPEMTTSTPKPPAGTPIPGSSFKPTDIPRRTVDLPGSTARRPDGYGAPASAPAAAPAPAPVPAAPLASDQRRLIVGRDISLNGEIGSCDVLVVEGTVEAKLREGRSIEIAESGLFKGAIEIDEADIGGRFEGDIIVRGRLTVRSTGSIHGSIKYGELAVEAGALLNGDIGKYIPAAKPAAAPAAPAEAAPAALDPIVVDG